MLSVEELHNAILYSTVRVRSGNGGGSGTVIYSRPNVAGKVETFAITNHHVISSLIDIREEWDPYLKRNVKIEVRKAAMVDMFRYSRMSYKIGEEQVEADVVAWHKEQDVALVKFRDDERPYPHVAALSPPDESKNLHIFTPIYCVGCALLHAPYPTAGQISSVTDEIDNFSYQMTSAAITFGNSGGRYFWLRQANG